MDHEAAFCPVDIESGSACETRSRSSSAATSSSDATSDEKSGDDKNEDEEEEEKMASEVVEAEDLHWSNNRFIEDEEDKYKVQDSNGRSRVWLQS